MGFQKQVNAAQAPAVEGDFADANPRVTLNAGPGGLVAGANGVTIGRFAWLDATATDGDGAAALVNNAGSGAPAGFIHREQQGVITTYLAEGSMVVPKGFAVTLHTAGAFWVKNTGADAATVGQKAFASLTTGEIKFAAAGETVAGFIETKFFALTPGARGSLTKITSHQLG